MSRRTALLTYPLPVMGEELPGSVLTFASRSYSELRVGDMRYAVRHPPRHRRRLRWWERLGERRRDYRDE